MSDLASKIISGDARALARAATLVENRAPEAEKLLQALFPRTGKALVVGITGPPGAGKSTLCAELAREFRQQDKRVAIIAVDPTSPYTGGAILGDRIRMLQHYADPGVFIRSMATRGWLGGLARTTLEMSMLLDAAGFDIVMVETVGVGQDEVEVARLADVTVVVLVPGMGDDVQSIKAGIMEIAQVFVINKADLPGVEKLQREIHAAGAEAPVLSTIASESKGIAELAAAIEVARSQPRDATQIWAIRLREMLRDRLIDQIPSSAFESAAHEVAAHTTDPYVILARLQKADRGKSEAVAPGRPAIDHLGIAVHSIDSALHFYRDQLDLAAATRETVPHEKVNIAMLPLADARIELLEPTEPDSPVGKFLAKRGEGLHHIALKIPDLNAAVEKLKASGARLLNEPRAGAGGHLYVFVHPASTGGVLLELIQS